MKATTDSQLKIRLPESMRRAFVTICQEQDLTASQVLRAYIREYLRKHAQGDLWGGK